MLSNLTKLSNQESQSTGNVIYDDAKSVLAFYSRLKIVIPSVIIIIVSIFFIIYGIRLIFSDESNIKSEKVKITKIINTNNLTKMCQDKVIKTTYNNKNTSSTSEKTVYNCIIYFNLFGKERMIQVIDSPITYVLGQEITVWYDNNNINKELLLSYYSLKQYKYMFILGGLLVIPLVLCLNYVLYYNDRLAMGLGVVGIADQILGR